MQDVAGGDAFLCFSFEIKGRKTLSCNTLYADHCIYVPLLREVMGTNHKKI